MKKNNTRRGAALMIAIITAVIVMLAATLLIGLTERMVKAHTARLSHAQVTLSEASAADGLAHLIAGGESVSGSVIQFELAGVATDFQLIETGTSGIRRGFYSMDDPEGTLLIPAGGALVSAVMIDGVLTLEFLADDTFAPFSTVEMETDMVPVAGAPVNINGTDGVVVLLQGQDETMICAFVPGEMVAGAVFHGISTGSGTLVSAYCPPQGSPSVIVTGGSGSGTWHDLASGESRHVSSPAGTTPVFMPDGTVFGSFSSAPSLSIGRVHDVFSGDFNNDGVDDMAFATSFSLSAFSGSTGELFTAGPGGSLACWGTVTGRNGLVGMWRMPGGGEKWFRLGYQGFSEFFPDMLYRMGWQGRFTGFGNTFAGFIDDTAVVATSAGYLEELLTGRVFTGDADGGSLDFFSLHEDGVEACFNPVYGNGLEMIFKASNRYMGRDIPGNTHIFSIYETPEGMRVFHNLEGAES